MAPPKKPTPAKPEHKPQNVEFGVGKGGEFTLEHTLIGKDAAYKIVGKSGSRPFGIEDTLVLNPAKDAAEITVKIPGTIESSAMPKIKNQTGKEITINYSDDKGLTTKTHKLANGETFSSELVAQLKEQATGKDVQNPKAEKEKPKENVTRDTLKAAEEIIRKIDKPVNKEKPDEGGRQQFFRNHTAKDRKDFEKTYDDLVGKVDALKKQMENGKEPDHKKAEAVKTALEKTIKEARAIHDNKNTPQQGKDGAKDIIDRLEKAQETLGFPKQAVINKGESVADIKQPEMNSQTAAVSTKNTFIDTMTAMVELAKKAVQVSPESQKFMGGAVVSNNDLKPAPTVAGGNQNTGPARGGNSGGMGSVA